MLSKKRMVLCVVAITVCYVYAELLKSYAKWRTLLSEVEYGNRLIRETGFRLEKRFQKFVSDRDMVEIEIKRYLFNLRMKLELLENA